MNADGAQDVGRKRLFAAGSIVGAILASSCCIAPLVLVTLGVSGAWMGNLTAMAPYQTYFIAATLILLAAGYWFVYFKPRQACEEDSYCASPQSDRIVKLALWIATGLIALAMCVNFVLPLLM